VVKYGEGNKKRGIYDTRESEDIFCQQYIIHTGVRRDGYKKVFSYPHHNDVGRQQDYNIVSSSKPEDLCYCKLLENAF
jgi:hypothetical protein